MFEEEEEKLIIIVDEREEKMVSCKGERPTVRLARFLKPSVTSMDEVAQIPPLLKVKDFKKCPFDVYFKGWKCPQKKWKQWVDQLKPKYGCIWKKTGIYDSIMASIYEFRKDKDLIIGLAEFWCYDTNTFVFSWGEATITLEDMLIIGGFSILGEPVTAPLTEELLEIENKMIEQHKVFNRKKAHKADHSAWLNHFIGTDSDLEHAAFLSLWLSRCVIPTWPEGTVNKEVFPVAIHLAQATRIALAPAVLASLYRDLRILKEEFASSSHIIIWAPFQIMQLWAWERFPSLQPTPNSLSFGEPRAARWNKLNSKSTVHSVRSIINSPDHFQWRPYSVTLENWHRPLYYKEQGEWFILGPNMNEELLSFSRCLAPSELVGLYCIKQYAPHRVGMQFGLDQDIPLPFARANANWESAWRTYDKPITKIRFYIPPRLFQSAVTSRYFDWWKKSISNKYDKSKHISVDDISSSSLSVSSKSENSESYVSPPPGIPCKHWWEPQSASDDEDKMAISDWYKRKRGHFLVNDKTTTTADKYFSNSQVQSSASTTKEKTNTENPMTDATSNSLYNKSLKGSNIFEENKDVRTEDSTDTYNHEQLISADWQIPGLELEARLDNLEMIVKKLKEKLASRKAQKTSGGDIS
ncbi:Aminotransferase-like, plant mobile domain family protein [Thalictrum thalictroides]|uniref:Aminotransferase-like, plant mobile domain family protein n=1 Tax=Thalictrum thalictroides TaxID=46969 RepID=A0A7J6V2T2_THATH|nr:Aminotransferase-like, plant mobile domain family protein [Thalictrum thalictroides]